MKISDMYNKINNPLDDEDIITKIVTSYSKKNESFGGFYGQLVKNQHKTYKNGIYNIKDSDEFYSKLFNKWKNSISKVTDNEYIELLRNKNVDNSFIDVRNYLRTIPDVQTKDEAFSILTNENIDEKISNGINKYRWNAFGEGSGWNHICSKYLTAFKDEYPNIEHRLYINTESTDTYKMLNYFIDKCEKYDIPFYFKFDENAQRDDSIVIYSSMENLTKYVDILNEIKKDDPKLIERVKRPPILTGKIDGWIGYGSEPGKSPDGKLQSFNSIRSKAIEEALDKEIQNILQNNKNMVINHNNQSYKLLDYLAIASTDAFMKRLEQTYNKNLRYGKNEKEIEENLGYNKSNLTEQKFKDAIYNSVTNFISYNVWMYSLGKKKEITPLRFMVNNNKYIEYTGLDLENAILELFPKIVKSNNIFITRIQNSIKETSKKYGIYPEKYCFDYESIKKINDYENQHKNSTNYSNNSKPNELLLNNITKDSITKIINPYQLNRNYKLPFGKEIPAKEYIEDIVFPLMPENGVVILNDGKVLQVKDFIEKNILIDCQVNYNGDILGYINSKTRKNPWLIEIEDNGIKKEIDPKEVTNYINPNLLGKNFKLPDGRNMTATQFIQEIYSPHIPENGKVILNNGAEVSAVEYIENVLLKDGQTKYNGNINSILYYTTRNNRNVINQNPQHISKMVYDIMFKTEQHNKKQTVKAH